MRTSARGPLLSEAAADRPQDLRRERLNKLLPRRPLFEVSSILYVSLCLSRLHSAHTDGRSFVIRTLLSLQTPLA